MKTKLVDIESIKREYLENYKLIKRRIIICAGTGCVANGALKVFDEFRKQLSENNLNHLIELKLKENNKKDVILLSGSGCQGFCQMGPLVTVEPDDIMYVRVKSDDVKNIVEKTLIKNEVVEELLYVDPTNGNKCKSTHDIPFYKRQKRFVLKKGTNLLPSSAGRARTYNPAVNSRMLCH